jgi:hypothetical protein
MRWPWSKDKECERLVKYQGTNLEIAGLTLPNIFSLGSVKVKSEVLNAADRGLKYLDLVHFNNCKTLKMAPDKESEKKYFDDMAEQQEKINEFSMAIAAYETNPDSQKLEEALVRILESKLAMSNSNTSGINKLIDVSMKDIEAESVRGATIETRGDKSVDGSLKNIKATKDVVGSTYTEKD